MLWGYSIGAEPTTDSTALGSVTKVGGWGQKSRKKGWKNLGQFHLPNRTKYIPACLDLDAHLTWAQNVFYRTRQETDWTIRKPLTDKPCQAMTSPSDKLTGLEKCHSCFDEFLGKREDQVLTKQQTKTRSMLNILYHHVTKTTTFDIFVIVSTGCGGFFGLAFAMPSPCVERFSTLTLSEENLQNIFIEG